MKHGSLFSGIGGFDLAASWMGWQNIFQCEIDSFCRKVLQKHFPETIQYEDIKKTDFTPWKGAIDILTGGFPCQPYSIAGKRKGDEDDRHLWPEMLRAIREIQPCYVVGENVRGLTNWNGGMVFDKMQANLEAEGYEVLPFLLPAAGINAPHERYRIWFIAYSKKKRSRRLPIGTTQADSIFDINGQSCIGANSETQRFYKERQHIPRSKEWNGGSCGEWSTSYSLQFDGKEIQTQNGNSKFRPEYFSLGETRGNIGWNEWPTQHPVSSGDDGISAELVGLSTSEYRRSAIGAIGNAIVPQIALQIFKAIEAMESL